MPPTYISGVEANATPRKTPLQNTTGVWIWPGWNIMGFTTTTPTSGTIHYQPIWVPKDMPITHIGVGVNSGQDAGKSVRLGIYEAKLIDGAYVAPGALLHDAGTVGLGSTGDREIAAALTLQGGKFYFLAYVHGVTSSVVFNGPNSGAATAPVGEAYLSISNVGANAVLQATTGVDPDTAFADPAPACTATTTPLRGIVALKIATH